MNVSFNSEHDAEINQPFTHSEGLPSENAASNNILSHPPSSLQQQYTQWHHYEHNENSSMGFAKVAGDQIKEQLHSYASYPEFPVELSNAETRSNSYLSQNQISSSSSSSSNSLSSKNNNNMPSSITSIQDLKSHFETLNTANECFNAQSSEIQPQNSQLSPQFDPINTSAGANHEIFASHEPFSLSNQADVLNSGFSAYPNGFDVSGNSRSYSLPFPCPERFNVSKLIGGTSLDGINSGNKWDGVSTGISDAYHIGEEPVTVSTAASLGAASSFPNNLDYQSGCYGIKPPPYNQKNLSAFYDAEKHQQQSYDQTLLQIDQSYSNSNQLPYPYSSIQSQQPHSHISPGLLHNHFQNLDQHLHQHQDAHFHVYPQPQQYLRQEHYENDLFYDQQANHHHSCPFSYSQPQFNAASIHPYYRHSFPQAYNMNPQFYQPSADLTTKIEEPSSFNEESNQGSTSIFNKLKNTKKPTNQVSKIQDGISKKPKAPSRKQSLQTFQEPAKKKSKILGKNISKQPLSQFQSPAFSFAPCPDSPSLSALGPVTLKPRAISLPVTPIKEILKLISPNLKSTSLDDEEVLRVKLESVELEKLTSTEQNSEKDEEDEDEGDEEDEGNDDEEDQTANNQMLMLTQNKKNVVKNIMSAFKTFVLSRGSKNQIEKIYNGVSDTTEDIDDIQRKFKRYIGSKNFNHYSLRLLILHVNYGPIFKYFLSSCSQEWLENSKIKDTESHQNMIFFFLSCFDDIRIIDTLRRHPKKKCRFS